MRIWGYAHYEWSWNWHLKKIYLEKTKCVEPWICYIHNFLFSIALWLWHHEEDQMKRTPHIQKHYYCRALFLKNHCINHHVLCILKENYLWLKMIFWIIACCPYCCQRKIISEKMPLMLHQVHYLISWSPVF